MRLQARGSGKYPEPAEGYMWRGLRVPRGHKKSPFRGLPQKGRESSDALLSRTRRPGTIGEARLNCRVRNGNGCDPRSRIAETILGRAGVPRYWGTAA